MELGIVFLSTSAPTAAATYAMIRNYGGDAVSTANLIGITTVGSMFTSSFGLLILRQLGWV
ncbi:auxin efflux carrier [Actinobacillus equuli]|nr:auxin efflux carrier [Actinobacillus equuli]